MPAGKVIRRTRLLTAASGDYEVFVNGKPTSRFGDNTRSTPARGRHRLAAGSRQEHPGRGRGRRARRNGPIGRQAGDRVRRPRAAGVFDRPVVEGLGHRRRRTGRPSISTTPTGLPPCRSPRWAKSRGRCWPSPRANDPPLACPLLRKEFHVSGAIRRATVYGSALGLYRLYINGRPVGNDYFTPGWTDYKKRVYYQTYDVTELLRPAVPTPSAACWPAAGTTAPRTGSTMATGRVCWPSSKSSWPTARCKSWPPTTSWKRPFRSVHRIGHPGRRNLRRQEGDHGWASPGPIWGDWQPVAVERSTASCR